MRKSHLGILAGLGAIFALRAMPKIHPLLGYKFTHIRKAIDSSAQSPKSSRGGNKAMMRLAKKRQQKIRAKKVKRGSKKRQ